MSKRFPTEELTPFTEREGVYPPETEDQFRVRLYLIAKEQRRAVKGRIGNALISFDGGNIPEPAQETPMEVTI